MRPLGITCGVQFLMAYLRAGLRVPYKRGKNMSKNKNFPLSTDTVCIHGKVEPDSHYGAVVTPIYQTSTFAFGSTDQGGARFKGTEEGYIYTRLGNPTTAQLEATVAALEEGNFALATSTGMAAVSTVYFGLLSAGDHVICSHAVYGPSRLILERDFSRFSVSASFVDTADMGAVRSAWTDKTRLLFVETPSNPTLSVTDLAACADLAHGRGALLAVDNTFLSPILQKPFRFGADVVLHSVTKFLNGHADVVGGVLAFKDEALFKKLRGTLQYLGGTMDPHQAWLVLRGIKTLGMRVRKGQENAVAVANLLASHPAVAWVRYPGLPDFKQAELLKRQADGTGSLIAFELKGGIPAAKKLLDNMKVAVLAVSLGGVETLIQHPATMTHAGMARESRLAAGITDGLVRLSVGCEEERDIIMDLESGLDSLV